MSSKKSVRHELSEKYREHLTAKLKPDVQLASAQVTAQPMKVCIVGGGIAGLYAALLLKKHKQDDVKVTIFEATNRVGGRVYTHWFSDKRNQYFECGAMRLPDVDWQKPLFDLIKFLNNKVPDKFKIKLINYQFVCSSGNRVYVNNTKQKDDKIMSVDYANAHLNELGFPPKADATKEAGKLLQDAVDPIIKELEADFNAALEKYDHMSLHYYLSTHLRWTQEKINYVEVMSSQTNEFQCGLVDQAILNSDFTGEVVPAWKTIEDGMCRLPEAMVQVIGNGNIHLNSRVVSLEYVDGKVKVGYTQPDHTQKVSPDAYDAVILALPPSSVRMIPTRPQWPVDVEHGIRSIHFQPLYKIGLRFKTRFWERDDLRPSKGGQSTTDLQIRWVVYPSYGIGDKGEGVLLLYSWMTDSNHWLPISKLDKIKMALANLQELYPEVDIAKEYNGGIREGTDRYLREAFPIEWAVQWPLGDATFYPSQFSYLFGVMQKPQGQIYFAGEHLSVYHTWILGAIDSAKKCVEQILGKSVDYLKKENR